MEVRYVGGTPTAYAPYQGRTYTFPKDLDVEVPEGLAALLLPLDDFVPGDAEAENYEPPAPTSNVPVRWRSDQQLITESGAVIPVVTKAHLPQVNMLERGAAADGTTDDWSVFTAARTSAGAAGVVFFPAKAGAAVTTYYLAGTRPDLSGTQIACDPSVVLKFDDANPNLKAWNLLTPVTVNNVTFGQTTRKPSPKDLALGLAAAVAPQRSYTTTALDFTTWSKLAIASGSFSPFSTAADSLVQESRRFYLSAAGTAVIQGCVTAPATNVLYEAAGAWIGTDTSVYFGVAITSADNHVVILRFRGNNGTADLVGSTALVAGAGTDTASLPRHDRLEAVGPATSTLRFGVKVTGPRSARIYVNGRKVYTATTLKDISAVGFVTNQNDWGAKVIENGVSYSTEFEPLNSRPLTVSIVGDSQSYGSWEPYTWGDLLPVALSSLPHGGAATIRQNIAVRSTTAADWAAAGGTVDINTATFQSGEYVCVLLGTNDIQSGRTVSQFRTDMQTITTRITSFGAIPVLGVPAEFADTTDLPSSGGTTPSNVTRGSGIRQQVIRLAAENGWPCAHVADAMGINWGEWYADRIHPNQMGNAAFARAFAQAISRHRASL